MKRSKISACEEFSQAVTVEIKFHRGKTLYFANEKTLGNVFNDLQIIQHDFLTINRNIIRIIVSLLVVCMWILYAIFK